LSPIAASVWRHCDGEHDLTGLAQLVGASEELIAGALHELREKELLDAEPVLMQDTVSGISRREAIGRAARYGAAAAAGSMIVSATAATPAMASSGIKGGVCEPSTGTNCCACQEECFTATFDKEECIDFCEENKSDFGPYKSWSEKSKCV
jgi:hypothetical protein